MRTVLITSLSLLLIYACGNNQTTQNTTVENTTIAETEIDIEASVDAYVNEVELMELSEKIHDYTHGNSKGQYVGFYAGDKLVKIIRKEKGGETEYNNDFYLRNDSLLFCYIRESKKNCKGPLTCAWELKQYYANNHLYKAYKRGDLFQPEEPFNMESRNFKIDTESNLLAEDTVQRNFAGYVISLFQGKQ
ncbi:MAG: hypothetical protein KBB37_00725 [Bacteroidia bacterium]|nr:hypothetical protein [Bacteroidia bacterium]MBP7259781.1 hypothetical protein [Bacteroidia bacterium]MBP9178877.1 hypothetical protein [Bacteroidia bacterium]MBP9723178.1 hypothetical protein [Bacteroidia bacterium]